MGFYRDSSYFEVSRVDLLKALQKRKLLVAKFNLIKKRLDHIQVTHVSWLGMKHERVSQTEYTRRKMEGWSWFYDCAYDLGFITYEECSFCNSCLFLVEEHELELWIAADKALLSEDDWQRVHKILNWEEENNE